MCVFVCEREREKCNVCVREKEREIMCVCERERENGKKFEKIERTKYVAVVTSGRFHALDVVFVPLEYIPSIPPHSTYVINTSFVLLRIKGARC